MPPNLLCASLFVCEKVLTEADGVSSAIRIVDVFYVPEFYPEDTKTGPVVQAYVIAALRCQTDDDSEHSLEVTLTSPRGTLNKITPEPQRITFKPRVPGAPGGVTVLMQLNLLPKVEGTSLLRVLVDGTEVARSTLTLLKQPPAQSTH